MTYTARAVKGRRKARYRDRFTINVIQLNFFLKNENDENRMSIKKEMTSKNC